jgi:hypothetical protein
MFMREARFPRREHPVDIEVAVRIAPFLLGRRSLSFGDVLDVAWQSPCAGVPVLPELSARFALMLQLAELQARGRRAVNRAASRLREGEAGLEPFSAERTFQPSLNREGVEDVHPGGSNLAVELGDRPRWITV